MYFSFFLIAGAVLLAGVFFRLGVDARVREIGTLQAVGFPSATIRRLFLAEGAVLAAAGSLLGAAGAIGYAGTLVAGVRTWWVGAIGTTQVFLHLSARDVAVGAAAGVGAALAAIVWSLRALRHAPVPSMLAGVLETRTARLGKARSLAWGGAVALVTAVALVAGAAAGAVPAAGGFFGAGALALASMLSLLAVCVRRTPARELAGHGWPVLVRFGARHVSYRPGRTLLCVALIAFATFVIVSVEAFRNDAVHADVAPASGTAGFPLLAQSALPIVADPNSEAGREALGLSAAEGPGFPQVRFVPFRERAGEDASCLNLYAPQEPQVLGASPAFVREARFRFQSSLATTDRERQNPWMLLESAQPDGAVPAVADATTIQYVLHRAVGDEVVVRTGAGAAVRLRLVAALRDSILQGWLIAVAGGWSALRRTGRGFRGPGGPGAAGAPLRAAALAGVAAVALFLLYRLAAGRSGEEPRGGRGRLPPAYARLARRLEREGHRPAPGTSMGRMLSGAVRAHPALAGDAGRVLDLYHRDRFGPRPLSPAEREEAFGLAGRLRREARGARVARPAAQHPVLPARLTVVNGASRARAGYCAGKPLRIESDE